MTEFFFHVTEGMMGEIVAATVVGVSVHGVHVVRAWIAVRAMKCHSCGRRFRRTKK
jgi:hypothetical protein